MILFLAALGQFFLIILTSLLLPQVCPAGPPQGMRGVPPLQLLPRGHRSHVDGLLRELRHLGAELRQRVERHDRPGEHTA